MKARNIASLLGLLALVAPAAFGAEQGKIYLNGAWVEAQQPVLEEAFSISSLFGGEKMVDISQTVRSFLDQNAPLLNVDRDTSWGVTQQQNGPELQTQRMSKTWMGLPVLGGDAVVHLSAGKIAFANADNTRLDQLTPHARIRGEEARAIAFASYNGQALHTSAPQLKVLVLGTGTDKIAKLVYEVTVRDRNQFASDIHFIDAQTAQELLVSTNVHTVDRQVVSAQGGESDFELDDTQWSTIFADKGCSADSSKRNDGWSLQRLIPEDPTPCNQVEEKVSASAHFAWINSGLVYDYYNTVHNRNSIDGNGMTLKSVVNFGGASFPNAAWYNDKGIMLYGMGDETQLNDFASPLDVVAHETTHGITSRTSNLEYSDQSGALNESYSDVFGKLVAFKNGKPADWKLGKELFKDGIRFVRDMENPEVGHMDDYMYKGQFCNRFNDFCGVHTNSGIPNKAAVLLAKKIGLEKLGKIYYLTLTQLLRTNSDFAEAKAQTEAACATLYGQGSLDCAAVGEAFTAVGI
jgi:Zn-dependent metalloprotease